MRPPICEVCRRKAVETVAFANYESLPPGMTGHPRGLGWFCRWHLRGARALAARPMGEAVRALQLRTLGVIVAVALLALAALIYAL